MTAVAAKTPLDMVRPPTTDKADRKYALTVSGAVSYADALIAELKKPKATEKGGGR